MEERDRVPALPAPVLLVQEPWADGVVRLHHHGSHHVSPYQAESAAEDDPHHGCQAYSARTGPTVTGNIADNHLSVVVGGLPVSAAASTR